MRRSTRYWIAAGSALVCAALVLFAYLVLVSIAYAWQLESIVVSRGLADAKGRDE